MTAKRSKRLNWTGRITIDKSCVDITREDVPVGHPETVTIDIDLSDYSFPKSAAVVVEASHRLISMRSEFGTIGDLIQSKVLKLSEFPAQSVPTFRLMVIDKDRSPGRLLGSAERIKVADTETSEDSRNIFKVDTRDLGEEVWRVEFDLDDYPKLIINRKIPNFLYCLEHDKVIQGLILPVAFRVVLSELALNLGDTMNDSGEDSWVSTWMQFCSELCGAFDAREIADDEDKLKGWIDDCVTEFAKLHSFASLLTKAWES